METMSCTGHTVESSKSLKASKFNEEVYENCLSSTVHDLEGTIDESLEDELNDLIKESQKCLEFYIDNTDLTTNTLNVPKTTSCLLTEEYKAEDAQVSTNINVVECNELLENNITRSGINESNSVLTVRNCEKRKTKLEEDPGVLKYSDFRSSDPILPDSLESTDTTPRNSFVGNTTSELEEDPGVSKYSDFRSSDPILPDSLESTDTTPKNSFVGNTTSALEEDPGVSKYSDFRSSDPILPDSLESTDTTPRNSFVGNTTSELEEDPGVLKYSDFRSSDPILPDCSESTDTTPRNSFSEDSSSGLEEGDNMRWKKKGDHPEYSKEEFMEEYSRQTSSKNSQKKARNPARKDSVQNNNVFEVEQTQQASGMNQNTTQLKHYPDALENRELTTNSSDLQHQKVQTGFGGGIFIAPPKPPRIQSQLSESSIENDIQSNPPKTNRSMSLPTPPPKPRRRSVKDEKGNEAEHLGSATQVDINQSQITMRSMGQQNGSDLVRRDHSETDYRTANHQLSCDVGDSPVGNNNEDKIVIRNKQTDSCRSEIVKEHRKQSLKQLATPDFPDDGYLRDDITNDQYEDSDTDDQYFDAEMHFRGWTWVYIGDDDELNAKLQSQGHDYKNNKEEDDAFKDDTSSISTTASEKEFKIQVKTSIVRKCSEIDYQRVSMYARERDICLNKKNGLFGLRIQRSRPVVVTEVDKGGAAEEAGIKVGDVILSINGNDVSRAPHSEVVKLASSQNEKDELMLVVGTNVCNSLNVASDQAVMSGYMYKRGDSGIMQSWKRRWFVLKQDNCLYYYKTQQDIDPLGAIVLANYTVAKAFNIDKPFAFKLKKFKAKTYYFYTQSKEEFNRWTSDITDATHQTINSNIWMGISSHNVQISALSINNPECTGYLTKQGAHRKNWKRRFFVLKDACMYYYENNSSQKAIGVVHFHGYTIQEIGTNNKKFLFDLIPPELELRTYHFQADHETDRKRWVAALALSIGKWIRTDICNSDDEEDCEMLI
ncbi:uncharacterized protein [Antedon mediterranea]|uniref:uncharacterized protein n=1 Tax=Antedon mediterranea TaxID=105859 RepID=UPI003AF7CC91